MGIKYANNASSQIITGISSSDTAIPVATGEGDRFPELLVGDWFIATIVDASNNLEIVKVTERDGDLLTVERAQESTAARSFSIGSRIELRLTAGAFTSIIQDIKDEAAAAISVALDTIVPIGGITFMPGIYVPPNFIKPNGAILSRILYPRLWTYADTQSGNIVNDADWMNRTSAFSRGDGATTFRIPDHRGEFFRCWDDGRGIDPSRGFGTIQSSQNRSHNHVATDAGHKHPLTDPGHNHAITDLGHDHQLAMTFAVGLVGAGFAGYVVGPPVSDTGKRTTGISIRNSFTGISMATGKADITIGNQGGDEARPRNVSYMPLMRFQ